ncbi:CATRA system-associated protein [Geodermatophilus poikilotrophus]
MAIRILPRLVLDHSGWVQVAALLDRILGALRADDVALLRPALAQLEELGAVRSGGGAVVPTQAGENGQHLNALEEPPPAAVRDRLARVAEAVATGQVDLPQPPVEAPRDPPERALAAEVPQQAALGQQIPLLVRVVVTPDPAAPGRLTGLGEVPPEGRRIVVTVSCGGLQPEGDTAQELLVPATGDSDAVLFMFRTMKPGLQIIRVSAFLDGTFLGELAAEVLVVASVASTRAHEVRSHMPLAATEPGEVTLQIRQSGGQYQFQFLGSTLTAFETIPMVGDPHITAGRLADELRGMARIAATANGRIALNKLKSYGAMLWGQLLPEPIRQQFWSEASGISAFTVASDLDVIPWELLYPVDGSAENGFLAEQFPVVRRVYGQGRARVLNLERSAFVVPHGSPANAMEEVRTVRSMLGAADGPVLSRLAMLDEAVSSAQLDLLHFACHNAFAPGVGSSIAFEDGQYTPDDLSVLVQRAALRERAPLVFLNACRTAGEIQGLTGLLGWASQFMRAGAGAFVGTLWAVRSNTARRFAEEFYRQLCSDVRPSLGAASLAARRAIAHESGDPTWLAYSVYGNPAARASGATSGGS